MNADEGHALVEYYADQAADEAAEAAASAEAEALAEQEARAEEEQSDEWSADALLFAARNDDDLGCRHCGWLGTEEEFTEAQDVIDVPPDYENGTCPDCGDAGTVVELATLHEEEQLDGVIGAGYLLKQIDDDATAVCIFCAWNGQYDELPPRTDDQAGDECPDCGEIGGITDVEELRAKYAEDAAVEADTPEDFVPLPAVNRDLDAYIIRKQCGCVFAAVIDTPQIERKNMADIMKFFIRSDMIVDRAPASEARRLLVGCTCAYQAQMEI